jgi:hypothetical protein
MEVWAFPALHLSPNSAPAVVLQSLQCADFDSVCRRWTAYSARCVEAFGVL